MEQKTNIKVVMVGILILLIGGGAAWGAFLMNKSYEDKNIEVIRSFEPTKVPVTLMITPTSAAASMSGLPKITVEGEAGVPEIVRTELNLKVINPLVDYYEQAEQGKLIKVNIVINPQANKTIYPYVGEAEFENKAKLGFVIEKDMTSFKWWKPECMGVCPFTDEYKVKYPEVVKN